MHVLINDRQVISAVIRLPRVGLWTAELEADGTGPIEGPAVITIANGAMRLVGRAVRSGTYNTRTSVKVAGGTGSLGIVIAGRSYRRVPLGLVLRDLLRDVGGTLAPSDDAVTGHMLGYWTRIQGPASRELSALLGTLGPDIAWRALPSGSLWVGRESWPESKISEYVQLRDNAASGRYELASNTPDVWPGELFQGRRVNAIEHTLTSSTLRTAVSYRVS